MLLAATAIALTAGEAHGAGGDDIDGSGHGPTAFSSCHGKKGTGSSQAGYLNRFRVMTIIAKIENPPGEKSNTY